MERGAAHTSQARAANPAEPDSRAQDTAPARDRRTAPSPGLEFPRFFTLPGVDPFDEVTWEQRSAVIGNERGEVVFEQRDVEMPSFWSQQATNIVVSKYFRGQIGTPEREHSVKQLIGRVVDTITEWGRKDGYFATEADLESFSAELKHILVYQMAAFNSPVWFNCGFEKAPQCSACFINSVQDTMDSILTLARTEACSSSSDRAPAEPVGDPIVQGSAGGRRHGVGSGVVHEGLRRVCRRHQVGREDAARREDGDPQRRSSGHRRVHQLQGRRREEGLGADRRRLRRLVHGPGVLVGVLPEFEQQRAGDRRVHARGAGRWELVDPGGDDRRGDGHLQSARSDAADRRRHLYLRRSRHAVRHDGQRVASVPNTARINASNPCSEYMFLDDSACNLASINLMKFVRPDGEFDVEAYKAACRTLITAQEILVDNASYPTPAIAKNSHAYRPLGLGYANLGALLMSRGLPYDSDAGRDYAAALTAIMTGEAYAQSARIARDHGGRCGLRDNREPFLRVMRKHRDAVKGINAEERAGRVYNAREAGWDEAVRLGELYGYRNAQATVLAPTGTIGFMMDCDTTGVEPDMALVKYKKLVGGGMMKIVNQTVPMALAKLGYNDSRSRRSSSTSIRTRRSKARRR